MDTFRAFCETLGGYLVEPDSSEEITFLSGLIIGQSGEVTFSSIWFDLFIYRPIANND